MRADERVLWVGLRVKLLREISESDAEVEVQLVFLTFQTVESHVRDYRVSMSQFGYLADSGVEETHAYTGIVRLRQLWLHHLSSS